LTSPDDQQKALQILDENVAAGARASELPQLLGLGLTTLQRWQRQFAGDGDAIDRRKGRHRHVAHRLSEEERQRILLMCNEPEFASLPPGQIMPILADVSAQSGVSSGCSIHTSKPIGEDERGHHRSAGRFNACEQMAESVLELGHHPHAHHRARCVALPLSGDQRVGPQGGGVDCRVV
jgi:hypothetical protein